MGRWGFRSKLDDLVGGRFGAWGMSDGTGGRGLGRESNSTIPVPQSEVNSRAVPPLRLRMSVPISSRSDSNFATPSCPPPAAQRSGVRPYKASMVYGLISFRSNSSFTTRSCQPLAAHERGVWPDPISAMLGLISSRSNRNLTASSCPPSVAHESGVWPYSISAVLGLISSRSNSNFTTPAPRSAPEGCLAIFYIGSVGMDILPAQ